MSIKLIVSDLDGTLFSSGCQELTDFTIQTIKNCHDKGINFVIATGRAFDSVPDEIKTLDLKYIISSNGARIHSKGKSIYAKTLDATTFNNIIPLLNTNELMFEIFIEGIPYVSQEYYDSEIPFGRNPEFFAYFKNTRKPVKDIIKKLNDNAGKVENINLIFNSDEVKEKYNKRLSELKSNGLAISVTSSFSFNIEIGGADVSKKTAIDELLGIEKITWENVLSFGDNHNDESMLRASKIGLPIKGSVLASFFNETVDYPENDGVAKYIESIQK